MLLPNVFRTLSISLVFSHFKPQIFHLGFFFSCAFQGEPRNDKVDFSFPFSSGGDTQESRIIVEL